ncbi:2-nitropropane dioxygenase [Patellaria atrata CBS 101060]|uniref:2-nitropropane dioxygenase n=1 Tax=Patellaria atrata CBS 101060 TaxID=1346257 RepID=A0A9P4VUQ4_9PEZI|nr:2-nitropropane dioxygenase [Patellaria atrata CBS 101060]
MSITTPITRLLKIQHPIMLAGMGQTSGADLVSAVSNAGGMGVLGGVQYTPRMLKEMISETKGKLTNPSLPFGVDLLLPQVGGSARKTNIDYTQGSLNELLDVVIEGGAKLFVSAVGVPDKWVVDKLHAAGILYMNVVGHPKHVHKACQVGADIICAQGGEAGGHTGDIPFSILIPACADICKHYKSSITGEPVLLVAAGGVNDGRSLAAALMLGASVVWIGTRFVASLESNAPQAAKDALIKSGFDSTVKTLIFTGRPLRCLSNHYLDDWEKNRQSEIKELISKGIIPLQHELDKLHEEGRLTEEIEDYIVLRPQGIVAGLVNKTDQPAGDIVKEIVEEAAALLAASLRFLVHPKL